jgi:hypothetical protein
MPARLGGLPSAAYDVLFERLTRLVGLGGWAEQVVECRPLLVRRSGVQEVKVHEGFP